MNYRSGPVFPFSARQAEVAAPRRAVFIFLSLPRSNILNLSLPSCATFDSVHPFLIVLLFLIYGFKRNCFPRLLLVVLCQKCATKQLARLYIFQPGFFFDWASLVSLSSPRIHSPQIEMERVRSDKNHPHRSISSRSLAPLLGPAWKEGGMHGTHKNDWRGVAKTAAAAAAVLSFPRERRTRGAFFASFPLIWKIEAAARPRR